MDRNPETGRLLPGHKQATGRPKRARNRAPSAEIKKLAAPHILAETQVVIVKHLAFLFMQTLQFQTRDQVDLQIIRLLHVEIGAMADGFVVRSDAWIHRAWSWWSSTSSDPGRGPGRGASCQRGRSLARWARAGANTGSEYPIDVNRGRQSQSSSFLLARHGFEPGGLTRVCRAPLEKDLCRQRQPGRVPS